MDAEALIKSAGCSCLLHPVPRYVNLRLTFLISLFYGKDSVAPGENCRKVISDLELPRENRMQWVPQSLSVFETEVSILGDIIF